MDTRTGRTQSPWMAFWPHQGAAEFPAMPPESDVEIAVVGAGIAGLTTAYLLAREGRRVAVIDPGEIGGGETSRTTAHLSNVIDDRFTTIERLHGARGARLAASSHGAAIEAIERILAAEKIDAEFERVDGYLFTGAGTGAGELDDEMEAARRAGLEVERLARTPFPQVRIGRSLRFAGQAQFHPLKYLDGLAHALRREGALLYVGRPGNHVEGIDDGTPALVRTRGGAVVRARDVVVATNSPIHLSLAIHSKQAPYRTYAVALAVPAGAVPHALYWDMEDPYHYVRVQRGEGGRELLIVGGEDHRVGRDGGTGADARFERLAAWARTHFPDAGEIVYRWTGMVQEPIDGLAHIGRMDDESHVFLATGDSGMGLTHGTIAGLLLADLVQGRANPWATLYDPRRKSLRAAGEYAKENLGVARALLEWVGPGDAALQEIAPGSGAVVRRGVEKLAVYRDWSGRLHVLSAVCTHLGCIVRWNGTESTWDCPCHGSRFSADGRCVGGPATEDLSAA